MTDYETQGYLPEAVINYLARLGWSHGDAEIFTRAQLVEWFDGSHLSHSPSQMDFEKLKWVNHQYMKQMTGAQLAEHCEKRLNVSGSLDWPAICELLKERCSTLVEMTDQMTWFIAAPQVSQADAQTHFVESALSALKLLVTTLETCAWDKGSISAAIKSVVTQSGLKMPQIAVPARLAVFGRTQTPAIDAMLSLMPRQQVLERLRAVL